MAVPKRKTSTARRDKRRTNWKLKSPSASKCPQCGSTKEPHRVCNNCGYYGEKEIFSPDDI
jgi:large subunit ribosomal protein L32